MRSAAFGPFALRHKPVGRAVAAMARYSKAFRQKEEATVSVARVYADINEKRPPEYWDYEALNVQVRVCGVQAAGDEGAQKNNSRHQGGAGMHTHSHTPRSPLLHKSGTTRTTTRSCARWDAASTARSLR